MSEFVQRNVVLDVFFRHDILDEDSTCADCAESLYEDEPKVEEPAPEVDPRAVYITHAWCAVRNGYKLRWSAQ